MNVRTAAVDLFCGVGGLTHGLERAGVNVVAGVEINDACEHAYEANNDATFVPEDVADLTGDDLEMMYPEGVAKVLVGCAPCQPFSNLNNGKDTSTRAEYGLLDKFGSLIEEVQPAVVAMENVAEIRNEPVYSDFVDVLFKAGYSLWFGIVECQRYGVPQRRRRFVLLASRLGEISLLPPTHMPLEFPTVRDTIGDVRPIKAGEVDADDPLHRSRTLVERNLTRIRQSRPGGTWRDWDPEIRLDCHVRESGRSFDSVYGRMQWDAPAPTITTQFYNYGSGRFGHPEQDRAISLREGSLLQTFPHNYEFVPTDGDVEFLHIGKFVGNAVPVRLGEVVGESILQHLREHEKRTEGHDVAA